MTISAVGSSYNANATSLAVTPAAVGDILVLVISGNGTETTASAVSGGGVTTWTKRSYSYDGGTTAGFTEIWTGPVTTAGPATISVTITGTPILACQEFANTTGGAWFIEGNSQTSQAYAGSFNAGVVQIFPQNGYTGVPYNGNMMNVGSVVVTNTSGASLTSVTPELGYSCSPTTFQTAYGYNAAFYNFLDPDPFSSSLSSVAGIDAELTVAASGVTCAAAAIALVEILTTGNLAATVTESASVTETVFTTGNLAATYTGLDTQGEILVMPTGNLAAKATSAINTSSGFAPTDKVPWMLPVAINDHPYVMDFQKSRITTMQIRRQSTDESVEAGEQTLSAAGVWPRAQDNFFLGAGQEFLDNRFAFEAVYVHSGETPSVRTRYWMSQGVNPWGEGKLTLHNEYASIATSSVNLLIVVCGNYLYKTDGTHLYWTLNPIGVVTPTWTQVTMSNTNTIVSLTSDGSRVWAACGSNGVYVTAAGTTTSTAAATPAALLNVQGLLAYAAGAGTTNTTNLPNSATTYYVTKVDAFGKETAATAVTITPAGTPINLNWQPDVNATSFNVYRGSALVYNGDVPSFVDDGSVAGAASTVPTTNNTGTTAYPATFIAYQKGHLIASTGRDLVEILADGSVSFIYQHENPAFLWTCATECPTAILVGGYAGSNSFIGAIQPDATTNGATLAPPIWASSLTPGEQINAIQYDSGSILLGTNLGIRSGTKPDSNGVFDVNPVIEAPGNVLCVASWSRFEYFGWSNYNPTENWASRPTVSGLGRADLSQYSTPGVPAYASDVMGVTSGITTQVVVMSGVPYFVVDNGGNYTMYGPNGLLVSSGWMEPGWVRYGSLENKILVEVDFQHMPLPSGASVSYEVVGEDTVTVTAIGTSSAAGSTTVKDPFSAGLLLGDRFMPVITLTSTPDQTQGPVFLSHITKAMTTTKRNDEVLLALVWDDKTRTLGPANKTWQMDLLAEYTYLKGLESTGNTVNLTMLSLVKVAYIDQVMLEPFDEVNDLRTFFRGTLTVKMITLS